MGFNLAFKELSVPLKLYMKVNQKVKWICLTGSAINALQNLAVVPKATN